MIDLSTLSEEQIIKRKDDYLQRLGELLSQIDRYLKSPSPDLACRIKSEYSNIKKEISAEAKYLRALKNDISKVSDVHSFYMKGITGADAYGFRVKINATINFGMHTSVEEAHYRLRKFFV